MRDEDVPGDRDGATVAMPTSKPGGGTLPMAHGTAAARPPDPESVRVFEVIGRGGMGEVLRAEQLELARTVAYKQLLQGSTEQQRERFAREARLTAQLDHPNIVPVHTLERAKDGSPSGYVMKLVEGKTLRAVLSEAAALYEQGKPLDTEHRLATLLEHFVKMCDALAFAHDRRILHRDLKPANVMIGRFGEVYVMDWGVAREIGAAEPEAGEPRGGVGRGGVGSPSGELTQAGEVVGSLAYMSPEQAEGRNQELDARADQYSLGLILFEIVTARRAITGNSEDEVVLAASRGEKRPMQHLSRKVRIPPELRAIVERATAFAPGDRYPSVYELAADVRHYLNGEAVSALPEGLFGRSIRWIGRHRRTTLLALVGVVARAAVVASASLYREVARERVARDRAQRLSQLSFETAAQAHRIDALFAEMESALEGLRVAAELSLEGPEPAADAAPVYLASDFAIPSTRPKDFGSETRYRWPVSVEHPVAGLAPSADRRVVLPKLRRLSPLRERLRQMIASTAKRSDVALPPAEVSQLLLSRAGTIDYAYVNLADGVIYLFPGMDSLPEGYDVRTAGFYTMSVGKRGARWGKPYVDSTTDELGDDLVLPCSAGLWSSRGEFLGVAGVEITVTKLVERGLSLPGRSVERASLVDADGRKVVDSFDANKRFKASGKDESIELAEFDIPEVAEAIRSGAVGLRELSRDGKPLVVTFTRLQVLGWYLVVEVDARSVLEPGRSPG